MNSNRPDLCLNMHDSNSNPPDSNLNQGDSNSNRFDSSLICAIRIHNARFELELG